MKRRALGKGLSSLIPDPSSQSKDLASIELERGGSWPAPEITIASAADTMAAQFAGMPVEGQAPEPLAAGGDHIREIPISSVSPNPKQPRQRIQNEQLEELAASIRNTGLLQPILVRPHDGAFQLVAGERRFRAAKMAGLTSVPAIVRRILDSELLEVALIENIQRQELNPIEEARAYQALQRERQESQTEIADRVGKQRTTVTNSIRLLNLARPVQEFVEEGTLSAGHARALLGIVDPRAQESLAREIISKSLSVRQAEESVRRQLKVATAGKAESDVPQRDPNVAAAETKLARKLSTKVQIAQNRKGGGRLVIEFYSSEELIRIYELILSAK